MFNDIEAMEKMYPVFFNSNFTLSDLIVFIVIFVFPFLIPYLYIRFFESRAVSLINNRIIPFIKFRLHLDKLIVFLKRALEFQIFRIPKRKFKAAILTLPKAIF